MVDPLGGSAMSLVSFQGSNKLLCARDANLLQSGYLFTSLSHEVLRTEDDHDKDYRKQSNPDQEFHGPRYATALDKPVSDHTMKQDCRQDAPICVVEDPCVQYRKQDDP